MSKAKRKKYIVVPGLGDPCPRCCRPTEIRQHEEITEKHRRQPFYFARWFQCVNPQCATQMICPERHKVWNPHLMAKRRESAPVYDDPNDIPERLPWWADIAI
jgi:hypothetical protein